MKMKNKYRKVVFVILFGAMIIIASRSALFASYVVEGESMEPTLDDGNLLMVNKFVYDLTEVDRFDVIVFRANEKEDYVKRVIGIPGDTIYYQDDKLYINGNYVEEDFLQEYAQATLSNKTYTENFSLEEVTGETKVPKGKLFVMGDNRGESLDSRAFGFIAQTQLVGKVDVKYWPISQASLSLGN
ncbi:signal peptidase I [Virgibacillus dokdonensis]|uniref:Signal peptidase I n=2 Tax=Virgibacillus dokdonensis TaxID=302167 RepID=A0ABU7VHA6_9BACI|nr:MULTISPECIES: signal peptidase I [Virgibacillus]NWO13487.1 signal peptidase I [Virgibacillus sp.]